MENVTLTPKEQTRLQVLNSLMAEHMTLDQAATLMGVSTRHTRRMLAAYREKGVASVVHDDPGRNIGRPRSSNRPTITGASPPDRYRETRPQTRSRAGRRIQP